jgi:glycosyltransferase involved in cell wall biosynthesis
MKIAVLSPVAWSTPPKKYGPWEQVASNVAECLVRQGHDVTLFATGDSTTRGKLESVCETPYGENPEMDPKVWECLHISNVMERADDFDIIHNHYDFLPLTYSKLIKTPMVTTIHGFSSPKILPVFKKYNRHCYYVSISHSDRSKDLDYIATVYNGVDSSCLTFNPIPKDYLLFFGRIHHDKGTFEAVKIAKRVGMKLIISGLIQDQAYFETKVMPNIDSKDVIYVGNSGPEQRNTLLGGAYALLHPINFEEPFGLTVAEAAFCGTPVIAFKRGSMPELIQHGKTGYLVQTIEEACSAVYKISDIRREACRAHAIQNFTKERMAESYLDVYMKILALKGK